MRNNSEREQTESGGDLTEQIRGQVDAAEQLLQESAKAEQTQRVLSPRADED